jgi:uncharacterized membrane-anchored protein YitT (DUF2179 family)
MRLKKKILQVLKDYLWITVGSLITAAAINIFLVPYKIAPGGVSGIATVLYYLSGGRFPVGVTMLAFNIPLFIAGMRYLGGKFAIRTFYGAIVLSVIIDSTSRFSQFIVENYFIKFERTPSLPDLLLYSIFGGALMGLG